MGSDQEWHMLLFSFGKALKGHLTCPDEPFQKNFY